MIRQYSGKLLKVTGERWAESKARSTYTEFVSVPRHICYEMGCGRLGCAGCIFSKDHELRIEMRENPAIFEALDRLEVESGYTMSMSGKRIRDRIK